MVDGASRFITRNRSCEGQHYTPYSRDPALVTQENTFLIIR